MRRRHRRRKESRHRRSAVIIVGAARSQDPSTSPAVTTQSSPPPDATPSAAHAEGEFSFQMLVRTRLDRENDLLMQRTAWVVATQAFLFSAYAIALNDRALSATATVTAKSRVLLKVIPWIGIASLVLLHVTISAAAIALARLRRHVSASSDPRLHVLDSGAITHMAGLVAPLLIPAAFMVTWVILLINE
jgi:hypothetical protein